MMNIETIRKTLDKATEIHFTNVMKDMETLNTEQIVVAIDKNPRLAGVLSTEKLREFVEYVVKGQTMPMREALRELTRGFMDNCGISAAYRTIYYDAGGAILEQYLEFGDDEMVQVLRKKDFDLFCQAMPLLHEKYDKEEYDEYDVILLEAEDYLIYCMEECGYNIPDAMKSALCYGVFLLLTHD